MNQKTETYLAEARKWLQKNAGPELDTKAATACLESAERAAREVESLKEKLESASEERRVAFLVLDETLKSAKHARKALDAREKAVKKSEKPKAKQEAEAPEKRRKG